MRTEVSVLFVCMGNICRSPTAHGVFRSLVDDAGLAGRIEIDSAGTHEFHIGRAPDRRATAAAAERGYCLDDLRARAVTSADVDRFDYVLAMDHGNRRDLLTLARADQRERVAMLLEFADEPVGQEVPDPYYGGACGFEEVLNRVEAGCRGLLEHIREQRGWR